MSSSHSLQYAYPHTSQCSCLKEDRGVYLTGDSNARVMYDALLQRLEGFDSILQFSEDMPRKSANLKNLHMVCPVRLSMQSNHVADTPEPRRSFDRESALSSRQPLSQSP